MDRSRYAIVPGTHVWTRFLWLVAIPTALCIAPWVLLGISSSTTVATAHWISAPLPLIGLLGALGYRWLTGDRVRLGPYVPAAVAAVVYAPAMIDLAREIAIDPDGAFIPVLPYGLGFLLPFLAFGGGAAAFTLVEPRNRA